MLEGTCRAGEILFVPRGVCIHGRHQHIKKVSTARLLWLLTSCVLCRRMVAPCCQPGGTRHIMQPCEHAVPAHGLQRVWRRYLVSVPAGHRRHHAELCVSRQLAECVATSAKPSTGIRVQPCGACHAVRPLCGSFATAQARGAKCATCDTLSLVPKIRHQRLNHSVPRARRFLQR
jgi:hypothetical protein